MKLSGAEQKTEDGKPSFKDMVFEFISRVSGNGYQISVHQEMIRFLGDPEMALFLCQLLYWADKTTNPKRLVYKSDREWREELGLSRYTMMKARKHLRKLGIIETELHMANGHATTHYKVNFRRFRTAFQEFVESQKVHTTNETELEPGIYTETEPMDVDDWPGDVYSMAEEMDPNQLITLEDYCASAFLGSPVKLMVSLFRLKTGKDHPKLTLSEFSKLEAELPICSDGNETVRIDDDKIIIEMLIEYTRTAYDDPAAYTFQHFNKPEVKTPLYKKVMEQRKESMEANND